MATTLLAPSGVQLLQNLPVFRISSYSEIAFVLKRGNDTILEESYKPDGGGQIEIQVRDIVSRYLETKIPTSDQYTQADAVGSFTAQVDGSTVATFTVVNGGVRNPGITAAEFLAANWLTWQPQSKAVTWASPEYLSYYYAGSTNRRVRAKFYLKNGGTTTITVASSTSNALVSYNMTMSRLFTLASLTPSDAYGVVDVWVETTAGAQLSYVQRYICRDTLGDEHAFLAVNSLGGIDTFIFHGECRGVPEVEHESAQREDGKLDVTSKAFRRWEQSTGYLSLEEAKWLFELLASRKAWAIIGGNAEPIVIDGDSTQFSDRENLQEGTFTYQLSSEGRLLNVSRTSGQLPTIEVPSPDGAIFFLEARLIDYPDADLSETLLFLLQQPYTNTWKKASFAAIFDHIYGAVLDSPVGQLVHSHSNGAVLDGFAEASNHLTYGGRRVAFFDEMPAIAAVLEWVEPVFDAETGLTVGIKTLYPLTVNGNLTALGDVIAYWTPEQGEEEEEEPIVPTAYDRLDFVDDAWPEYDEDKAGWILSAALGWDLNSRVTALEAGAPHTHANLQVLDAITAEKVASWDAGGASSALFEAITENDAIVGIRAKYALTVAGGVTASGNVSVTGAISATGAVSAGGNITATGDIVAYGTASGGSTPTAYDRLDPVSGAWPAYDSTKAGWILSAALGWDLNSRLSTAESSLTSLSGRVTALENSSGSGSGSGGSSDHSHTNLSLLETITQAKVTSWDTVASLFSTTTENNAITGITALHPLAVTGGITATGDIVAYGTASGGSSPTAYDRLDPVSGAWPTYDSTKAGWILSAALGWDLLDKHTALATRVTALENSSGSGSGSGGSSDHSHTNLTLLETITQAKVTSWDTVASLFSAAQSGDPLATTGINALYPLAVAGGITATGDIVAYGTASGGSSPTAYDRLDPVSGAWPTYDSTKAGWILSAALGWDLNSRVATLEQGGGGSGSSSHTHSNLTVLDGITSTKVTNWDTAYTNNHTHSNLSVLETITAERIEAWDAGGGSGGGETGHTHSNLSVLNNITSTKYDHWEAAYSNSHSHSNKSVLDGITSSKVSQWDTAYNYYNIATYDANGNTLATRTWVSNQGYLTSHQSLSDYAKLTDLHSHSNKTVLDGITSTKVSNWDGAATNSHTHSNKTVLDGITSTKVSNWDGAATNSHTHSNKSALDDVTSTKISHWDSAYSDSHTHSNKSVLDGITSTKVSNWDGAATNSHTHSNKTVLDGITSAKVSSWDTVAAGSWLPTAGGTLTGALTGTTATFNSATFGTASNAGSVSIVRKIGSTTYTATVSIDSSGNVVISPTSTGKIKCSGTVYATGDVLCYQ